MTDPTTYRTNRDLFSNHYLNDHLRDTEPWNEVSDADVEAAYDEISELLEDKRVRVDDYNEAQLERNVIRPIFEILDIPFEIEETVMRNARRPDYGFFPSDEAADAAFDREDFYEEAIAVADAKRWGRKLDTRGEEKRDFENPSYQIHRYLQETPTEWAVLTNGEKWRLYYGPTSHRLDSFYEIDLPELLDVVAEDGDLEAFKEFYLFFRQGAFLPDQSGDCFLDDVYDESSVFAEELGEDLQENIYEAIRVLAEGFLDTNEELDEDDLDLIHDSSLIYLYRMIFVLYAESEGRNLLPTDNDIYSESFSLNELKQTVVENRNETQQHYQAWQTQLWDRLEQLFVLIDEGSEGQDIPKEDLYIPAYNGGLFRTHPDSGDPVESQFLASYEVGDAYLGEVIELLTRHDASEGAGKVFVDYSSLDERNLGSIYEGLLEYKLDIATGPLTVEDGEYVPAGDDNDVIVEEGDVYLRTDDGERKVTGSYYTPEYVVEYIVDETLEPLVEEIRQDLVSQSADTTHSREGGFAEDFAERVFDLAILDPAMGSGHFLVNAVDYLAREIIDAQERQDRQALEAEDEEVRSPRTEEGELRDINWARRKVAQRCIYGVDVNPLATELSKVSLWLRTLAAEQPLAFLDHHLKTGNSLVGSDIEEVLSNGEDVATEDGQLTLQQSFDHTRKRAMEHVTDRFQDLLTIDNETLEDAKEMEAVYDEVREDPLYRKLLAMSNVHTADTFGLNVPDDADERMARALNSDDWETIEGEDWFKSARSIAEEEHFFHWELEFPMAFYDQDGERKANAGFDAVIGNPPWLNAWRMTEKSPKLRDAIKSLFSDADTLSGHWDLYVPFVIKSLKLCKEKGTHSFILPNTLLTEKYTKDLRESILSENNLLSILDFEELDVFQNVERQVVAYHVERTTNSSPHEIRRCTQTIPFRYENIGKIDPEVWLNVYNYQIRIDDNFISQSLPLIDKVDDSGVCLGNYLYVNVGATVSGKGSYSFKKDDVVSDSPKGNAKKFFQGSDVQRWAVNWSGEWLDYRQQEMSGPRTPEMFENDKIVVRKRTNKGGILSAGCDESGMYCDDTVLVCCEYENLEDTTASIDFEGFERYSTSPSLRYLLSIVNSSLMSWVFKNKFETGALQGSYSDVWPKSVRSFPLPPESKKDEPVSVTDANIQIEKGETTEKILSSLSKDIEENKQLRQSINLNLLDYLGKYKEGQELPDIGIFQPSNPEYLDETTEDYEKLQIERTRTTREGPSVTIHATARYKPEEEDEFETDTYGYTETDFFEAFTLTDLSEGEAALIEAFVPVAVDQEIGGFRDNATKTNSLIDRLKGMTLPDPDDVADDLQRYIEAKERADELDEKIWNIDRLIDEIVYDLYDLTEEEIEIVEEAVNEG
ncbi:TaqI-like C-terminal specificity domain-containing protein [Halorubellus sp. PRR65]|uniref:Eco57I restriction-modification methylase domain-containing protein n=1 Tax=Halorubellus sp. PRR65 TaxID=3098148 RepID=UPI002B2591CE|nr:TaqI-like C-terminal specificity domain-containing protein [Halorubellus sp. PRR65]